LGTYINVLLRQTDLSNGVKFLETRFAKSNDLQLHSDYYVQDASFIKLDNVSVGYTFNQNQIIFISELLYQLKMSIITKYDGLDPEISGGIDNTLYPRPITFTLGLNVNF
jgi:iron complex outermembrane receptor protein